MSKSAPGRRIEDIVDVPISDLHPHPDNPRKISRDRLAQLKRSLETDPDLLRARPLIALRDGTVIAGNQRLRAAVELGWPSVPVVYADVDEQTARLWMLRDNNSFGDWDERPLAEMLAGLAEGGVELALAGFEGATVDGLLAGLEAERDRPEPDDVPPVPSKPRSKPGEVYELGPHRLMCGDATQALAALMDGELADLVVTDPPYGVDIQELDMAQADVRNRRKDGKGVLNDHLTGDALDPFAGSGSTMIAADKLGRRCFMVELDPGYCDVIRDRWEAWNGDQG